MTVRSIADLQPRVDVEQASRHLRLLHDGAEGFVSLILLGQGRREQHGFTSTDDLWTPGDPTESAAALQEIVDERWNVYTACAAYREIPERGRGSRTDVASIPGVWADLDVKQGVDGFFQSEDEVTAYLRKLIKPTLEVASGSGGRHAYWLLHEDQRITDLRDAEKLLGRWRDYLLAEADGLAIDYVHDATRVLRLAGTVRWPKDGEDVRPALVNIVDDAGPRYHVQELRLVSQEAYEAAEELRRQQRERQGRWQNEHRADVVGRGLSLMTYDRLVTIFNYEQDWGQLLERDGWTLCADQRGTVSSCRYWTRPGKAAVDGKSAATDWVDAAGVPRLVMTIYSRDPSLEDIYESQTERGQMICTKWHFALVRLFNGDEGELLRSVVRGNGVLGD